ARAVPLDSATDPSSIMAPALIGYVDAKRGRRQVKGPVVESAADPVPPSIARERDYWLAAAALARGDAKGALQIAAGAGEQAVRINNDELAWRTAAVGSLAARALGLTREDQAFRTTSTASLERVRRTFGDSARSYDARPDLVELRKAAAL